MSCITQKHFNLFINCHFILSYQLILVGNVHVNVTTPVYSEEVAKLIEPFIYDWTAANGGSVSAEHGLGKNLYIRVYIYLYRLK